jgi:hypothetical protein
MKLTITLLIIFFGFTNDCIAQKYFTTAQFYIPTFRFSGNGTASQTAVVGNKLNNPHKSNFTNGLGIQLGFGKALKNSNGLELNLYHNRYNVTHDIYRVYQINSIITQSGLYKSSTGSFLSTLFIYGINVCASKEFAIKNKLKCKFGVGLDKYIVTKNRLSQQFYLGYDGTMVNNTFTKAEDKSGPLDRFGKNNFQLIFKTGLAYKNLGLQFNYIQGFNNLDDNGYLNSNATFKPTYITTQEFRLGLSYQYSFGKK